MTNYNIDSMLREEAQSILSYLKSSGVKCNKVRPVAEDSAHFGRFVDVAKFDDKSFLEPWFDHASGHAEPMFWVGFYFDNEQALDASIDRAASAAKPQYELTISDIYDAGNDNWLPRTPVSGSVLNRTGCERYPADDTFYLGRYFSDYSTELAVAYVIALTGGETNVPDGFWEGEVVQYLATRYERDPNAREACLKNHGFVCCVCDFDFQRCYGELGKQYIHVHHTLPLSKRDGGSVTLAGELVPVCPNCHAMLHRRELKTPAELRSRMNLRSST